MQSDSLEKSLYFEEFASNLHQDFSQTIYQVSFSLAKSYYNIATQSQADKDYSKAEQNLNFARQHFERYIQSKSVIINNIIEEIKIQQSDHEEVEYGIRDLKFRIDINV